MVNKKTCKYCKFNRILLPISFVTNQILYQPFYSVKTLSGSKYTSQKSNKHTFHTNNIFRNYNTRCRTDGHGRKH